MKNYLALGTDSIYNKIRMKKISSSGHWYFIVLALCILATFLSFKSRKSSQLCDNLRFELLQSEQKVNNYYNRWKMKLLTENRTLDNVELTDLNNEKVSMSSLISSPKLIYRFSDDFCKACIEDDIELLKLLGDSIGYQNIIIITDNDNARLLNIFKNTYQIESPCYNFTGCFNLKMENNSGQKKVPFFLLLDAERSIHFAFFTDEDSELTEIYMNKIRTFFISHN